MKVLWSGINICGEKVSIVKCDNNIHNCLHLMTESKYPPNCSGYYLPKVEDIRQPEASIILMLLERLDNKCF